jgi:hypothetical protein
MNWQELTVSPCGTHHLCDGVPAYEARFDMVLKFHAPGLAPVKHEGLAWHIHPDGKEAYHTRFSKTFGYYEGIAAVADNSGWYHIDTNGDALYESRYDWCGNFQEGRCAVRDKDGSYLHLTNKGKPLSRDRWRYAGDYRDDIAVVQADDGRSTHVDAGGQLLHSQWFFDLDVFHKGFARARDKQGWAHVDIAGKPIYAKRFAAVEPFYNGQARVERFDAGLEVIDEAGGTIIELRPALGSEFAALSADMVGFWRTQTIAAAVELGLFEVLPGTVETIATQCRLHGDRTERLLRALAELSLVRCEETIWSTTGRGDYLRSAHPLTLADAALEYAVHFSSMWQALPQALRRDGMWQEPDIFADVAQDAGRQVPHHRMLQSYARHDYPAIPATLGLQGSERVVDAGGGLGVLANALLDEYPDLEVFVLERPEVVAQARRMYSSRAGLGWISGDLFEPWNTETDVVVMARILHDWADEKARQILRQARRSLSAGGKLFVIEMLLSEQHVAGSLCDLHLLMATGGKERTASAYASLMDATGFKLVEVRYLPALPSVLVGLAV